MAVKFLFMALFLFSAQVLADTFTVSGDPVQGRDYSKAGAAPYATQSTG